MLLKKSHDHELVLIDGQHCGQTTAQLSDKITFSKILHIPAWCRCCGQLNQWQFLHETLYNYLCSSEAFVAFWYTLGDIYVIQLRSFFCKTLAPS